VHNPGLIRPHTHLWWEIVALGLTILTVSRAIRRHRAETLFEDL
jgi:hypothetical protein